MKQRKIYVALFTIIAFVLCEKESMGQVVVVDSIISNGFFNPEGLTKISKDTKSKEITIRIEDKTPELKLQIGSQLTAGIIYFTIYDPTGKQRDGLSFKWTDEGDFYIVDDIPNTKSGVWAPGGQRTVSPEEGVTTTGIFIAYYKNPIPGKWVIKVSPKQAEGNYKIYQILTK